MSVELTLDALFPDTTAVTIRSLLLQARRHLTLDPERAGRCIEGAVGLLPGEPHSAVMPEGSPSDLQRRGRALRHGLDATRLKRVLDYIRDHLGDDLGIEELAAAACLSPFHFTRMFRDSMGVPPHRYVADLRLERAKSMLADGEDSLVEIALATCFSSQSNFTRAFRHATGMTPGEFRRRAT